jgi:hypothetical protein
VRGNPVKDATDTGFSPDCVEISAVDVFDVYAIAPASLGSDYFVSISGER